MDTVLLPSAPAPLIPNAFTGAEVVLVAEELNPVAFASFMLPANAVKYFW